MASPADSDLPQLDEIGQSVYQELHAIAAKYMRRERPGMTIQATALVNEIYIALHGRGIKWESHAHFVRTFAQAMRYYLIDQARRRRVRAGRVHLDPEKLEEMARGDVLPLDETIALAELIERLTKRRPRAAHVVELRAFGGFTFSEIGEQLGIHRKTAEREWEYGLCWLRIHLEDGSS